MAALQGHLPADAAQLSAAFQRIGPQADVPPRFGLDAGLLGLQVQSMQRCKVICRATCLGSPRLSASTVWALAPTSMPAGSCLA